MDKIKEEKSKFIEKKIVSKNYSNLRVSQKRNLSSGGKAKNMRVEDMQKSTEFEMEK